MKTIKNLIKLTIILTIIFIFCYFYSLYEASQIKIVTYKLDFKDVPASFKNKKIVFVTDIHYGKYLPEERLDKLVDMLNEIEPDILLYGGDYVNRNETDFIKPCFEKLSNVKSKNGAFGVLGNHDYSSNFTPTTKYMEKYNITNLTNDYIWLQEGNEKIKICGIGDYNLEKSSIKPLIDDVTEEDFVILLSHNPDYVENLKTNLIDLVLSGHTHGGQLTFFGLFAPYVPSDYGQKYRTGIVKNKYTTVIISNGIGSGFFPGRFFCHPQIVIIQL